MAQVVTKEFSKRNGSLGDDIAEVTTEAEDSLPYHLEPHESYEGRHRWDPEAKWSPQEERYLVRKTDVMLLSWICIMVSFTGTRSKDCLISY